MSEERREALKIIGAIGTTCAFPFSADELYGQHAHAVPGTPPPGKRQFFTLKEMEAVSRLADLMIPETGTPGAVAAGVPAYIDLAVSRNRALQRVYRDGLRWLDKTSGGSFVALKASRQVEILGPLVQEGDQLEEGAPADLPVRFLKAVKSMTADGYFTSKVGLIESLGYRGNTVLDEFPECTHEH